MTEYVGQKSLLDQYLELKAENERLRKLVAELPKCCSCGGIIKPEQGGQCMPCLGEETLPDSAQETVPAPAQSFVKAIEQSPRRVQETRVPICSCGTLHGKYCPVHPGDK